MAVIFSLKDSNGNELAATRSLLEFHVWKQANFIAKARLVIADGSSAQADYSASNDPIFEPGNELQIFGGLADNQSLLFKGIIIKHAIKMSPDEEGKLELELRDKAIKLTDARKSKVFADVTDSDIFDTIVSPYSIDLTKDTTNATHKEMIQYDCTDWDFILSRADANGLWIVNSDGTLTIQKPDASQASTATFTNGGNVHEFEAEIDARTQYTAISTQAWNQGNQEVSNMDAQNPTLPNQGNLSSDTLAGIMAIDNLVQIHGGSRTDDELQSWADALKYKSALAKITGRMEVDGNKDLLPGKIITLAGFGNRFNGDTLISGVYHHFDMAQGWYTDVVFGMDQEAAISQFPDVIRNQASAMLPAVNGLQIGIVESLSDDTEGEFKIKVKVPLMGAAESVFARVSMGDAGSGRGSFIIPEVGDEVVLGFLHDDPRDAIILGRLYSSANAPASDFTLDDDNFVKGFVSKNGIKIIIDDDKKIVNVETPAGKKITLDEDAGTLTLVDENNNKIEFASSGITIQSDGDIEIKATGDLKLSGTNLEAKASAQFKASGSGGTEVSSSAITTIKGSLVQIN